MKANEETLRRKMEVIDENMSYLESVENNFNPGEADFGSLQAAKHSLLEIAEACIDIGSHIIAAENFQKPDDYSEVFPILAENKVIDEKLGDKLSEMAGFRNYLVHRYDDFDNQRLEKYITEDLEDIKEFTTAIYNYINQE